MTEDIQEVEIDERHPFRFLLKFAIFVGVLYMTGRFFAQKKNEYADLTESEARDKFVGKMAPRVGDDTATEIADQVIPKLKERGLIKADPTESGDDADAAEKNADQDEVSEAVDSVVKD